MAVTISFHFPELEEAINQFCTNKLYDDIREDLNLVSYYADHKKIHLAGRFTAKVDSSREERKLLFKGNVTYQSPGDEDAWIYSGKWNGECFEMESMICNLFTIKGKELSFGCDTHNLEVSSDGLETVKIIDNAFVRVRGTKIEFPLLPYTPLRLLAPDGEYVNIYTNDTEEEVLNIEKFSFQAADRLFVAQSANKEIFKVHFNFNADYHQINFFSISQSVTIAVEFLPEDARNWLAGKSEDRNIFRALKVTIPSLAKKPQSAEQLSKTNTLPVKTGA